MLKCSICGQEYVGGDMHYCGEYKDVMGGIHFSTHIDATEAILLRIEVLLQKILNSLDSGDK